MEIPSAISAEIRWAALQIKAGNSGDLLKAWLKNAYLKPDLAPHGCFR
jgi:hypothetical protein